MLSRVGPGVIAALAAAVVCYARLASADSAPRALIAPWGLDLTARDPSVKPGDKLYLPPEERVHIW
jgi:hypothetical protein